MTDPTDIQAESAAIDAARQQAALDAEQAAVDLAWVMSDERGRRFIWSQLQAAGIYTVSFDPEPAVMAFREGQRNIGLKLLADLHAACWELVQRMTNEARAKWAQ